MSGCFGHCLNTYEDLGSQVVDGGFSDMEGVAWIMKF